MKPQTYHSSVLAHNPHTSSCRLETTPRPLTIPTTVLALSKWMLLSCSGMDDNIFNSWMGNYRSEVLAVSNRHHYPIVILLPVSRGDSPPASGSAQRVEASSFSSPLSTPSAPQSHNHMPCFMLWAEPIFLRTGSFISLSLCFFHWASLCSCQWFPFVLRQELCVSQAGHLTYYVAQAGSKSWSSYP